MYRRPEEIYIIGDTTYSILTLYIENKKCLLNYIYSALLIIGKCMIFVDKIK